MPGPNSEPLAAKGASVYSGKTMLSRLRTKSGEGMRWSNEYRRREERGRDIAKQRAEKRASHVSRR